jgi:hypothetical protein
MEKLMMSKILFLIITFPAIIVLTDVVAKKVVYDYRLIEISFLVFFLIGILVQYIWNRIIVK